MEIPYLKEFLAEIAGKSFNGGLYRTHTAEGIIKWTKFIEEEYPSLKGKVLCFGSDWKSVHYCISLKEYNNDDFAVIGFELCDRVVLRPLGNFCSFHNEMLLSTVAMNELICKPYFDEWMQTQEKQLEYHECAGHKKYLCIGGEECVENLERIDMDVHLTLQSQIYDAIGLEYEN